MLAIQIGRVEIRKEYPILVDSKKKEKEGRNTFFYQTKKNIGKKKMLGEVDSHKALHPQICQIRVLGTPAICLFVEVRL